MRKDRIMSQNKEETTTNGDTNSQNYISLQKNEHVRKNIQDISQLLNTGLSAEALDICIELCEAGVHPQALAEVVNQIRKEVGTIKDNK